MENVQISLAAFEGPLELLIHLIEKNKIDIYDIPIAVLTDQYLAYLEAADAADMENLSAFLVTAAQLLELKSRMLLPKPEPPTPEEADPRQALVERLLEYKKFKAAAAELEENREVAAQRLFRLGDGGGLRFDAPLTGAEALRGVSLTELYAALEGVLARGEARRDPIRSTFAAVERDRYTVADRARFLRDLLRQSRRVTFWELFRRDRTRDEIVATFLALLDLMKAGDALVSQEVPMGEIVITGRNAHEAV